MDVICAKCGCYMVDYGYRYECLSCNNSVSDYEVGYSVDVYTFGYNDDDDEDY